MQNIDKDLEFAIEKVLCGTWKERKDIIDKVFVEDATFWYTQELSSLECDGGMHKNQLDETERCWLCAGISSTMHTDATIYTAYTR